MSAKPKPGGGTTGLRLGRNHGRVTVHTQYTGPRPPCQTELVTEAPVRADQYLAEAEGRARAGDRAGWCL